MNVLFGEIVTNFFVKQRHAYIYMFGVSMNCINTYIQQGRIQIIKSDSKDI